MAPSGSFGDSESPSYGQWFSRLPGSYDWYLVRKKRVWHPPTDVYETDHHVVVKVEVAGMSEDDFQISFADRRLVIAGQRKDPVGKIIYQNMEINYGDFRSEILINGPLEQSPIEATYEAGFLFVKLPKAQERRVPVRRPESDEA